MLVQRPVQASRFTRRDLVRLLVASIVLILALITVLASDIVPTRLSVTLGQVATTDIVAPRATTYTSDTLTQEARDAASAAVAPQYDYTPAKGDAAAQAATVQLNSLLAPADAAFSATLTDAARAALLKNAIPGLSDEAQATLVAMLPSRWPAVRDEARRLLGQVERAELRDSNLADTRSNLAALVLGGLQASERQLVAELVAPNLVPNSSYSTELTDTARQGAAAAVAPVPVSLSQGQVIVRKGDPISALQLEQIEAFGLNDARLDYAKLAGWALLAILIVGLVLAWVWRFRPTLWHRTNVLLLIGLLLVFTTLALKLTAGRSVLPFFVPTAAAGILIAILLDASTAVVLTAMIAVIGGAVNGNSLELTAYIFMGGLAGIVAVRRGDRVNAFVQAAIAIFVVNALVVSTFSLLGERDITGVLQLYGASAAAAGGAAIAAVGSFAVIGNLFGILTVFQLLELANPSQPLLRRLLIETPGTYHHSIMVGNLAERAAEAIGADPLITRVAAYYHDVGKLASPTAFIENQSGGDNVHDELEPEVSAAILKAHVSDGIEIAYRAHLPKPLIAFIPQHHGTALMSFFYAKAREEAAAPYGGLQTSAGEKAADAVDQRTYRHNGPKPQTREAALLMLADGVEASVRSLSSRDEPAIRAMVNRIIEERLQDGQFDECDLTLRDIERIREAYVSQLLGMYHQRIAYPQSKIVELEARRAAAGGGSAGAGPTGGSKGGSTGDGA
ncbi:MAG: HD family phosphohydrolase [Candidatus Limnocylindrales bacterium]